MNGRMLIKFIMQTCCDKNNLSLQTKEIQALQTRMQASHDSHTLEVQTLQTQLHQLQDVMSSSSVGNIQRLQEVKISSLFLHLPSS